MEKLSLQEIISAVHGSYGYPADVEISDISTDTRTIKPGSLFIALKGENFDGHNFAAKAMELGAEAVVTERPVEGARCMIVDSTARALLDIAGYYRSKFDVKVVGVTGSVGKTTTKDMIALVVAQKYKTLKTQGNHNNEIGMPQTLFGLDSSYEAAVIEMGMSHQGEISRMSMSCQPDVAVITNIGISHIENLGSREGILKSKLEILDGLEAGSPFIINVDNDMLKTILDKDEIMEKYDVITFGIESESANYKAKNIKEENGSTSFDVEYIITKTIPEIDGVTAKVYLCSQHIVIPTIGIHNVYNALAAFAVGITLGIDSQKSADALSNYVPAGMRQKSVNVGGITSIEDCYNASPDSMNAAIKTLANTKANKKIAVLGDMLELGDYSKKAHYEVGQAVADNKIDFLLAFGNDAKYIVDGAKENGMKNAFYFNNKEELSNKLFELANKGDAVIFKASRGMKLEDVINNVYDRWEK